MTTPNPLQPLRIVPLGGLGEIGMNCLAIEASGDIIVIDCGVTFPHSDLGIDIYHPDFAYLERRRSSIRGVVLTHGHEDHIGAIPYLLRRINAPIWGPPHALALIAEKLEERGFDQRQLRSTALVPKHSYDIGAFRVEPVRVTHSITDACALIIRAVGKTVVHTGDFKFDPAPPDGDLTDFDRFEQIAHEGVDLLLSDSTNIDAEGTSGSEMSVGNAIDEIVAGCQGRVVVGMFSSNVQRLRLIGDIAKRNRRRICLLGRSVHTHVRTATRVGRLEWPSDLLVPSDLAATLPRKSILCIASGTQAEPLAALWRLATRTHPAVALDRADSVILSSRIIPGNEPGVFRMFGHFIRQDVNVHSRVTNPGVHVSGHAHRDEQRRMIEMLHPRAFIPVHGTLHHLKRHADFARSLGVPDVLVAEDGDVVEFRSSGLRKTDVVEVGKIATFDGEEIPDDVLKQREVLGRTGVAVVTLQVDARGKLLAPPFLSTRGVLDEGSDVDILRNAARDVADALAGRPFTSERPSDDEIIEVAERAVRRNLDGITGRRPVTVVHVVRP